MFYQPSTGFTFFGHSEIRQAMWTDASVLFSDVITPDDLAAVGIFPLQDARPSVGPGQVAEPAGIEQVDGVWTQLWSVRAASAQELAAEAEKVEQLRTARSEDIDQWRAAANASTFPYGGKQISSDPLSRSDIDGVANHIALFGAFPTGFPGGWKATDQSMLPLADVDAFRAMYAAMTEEGTRNFNRSQELKARLAVASTQEEIAAIQWSQPVPAAVEGD